MTQATEPSSEGMPPPDAVRTRPTERPQSPAAPHLAEKGGPKEGVRQSLDRRLFMQFLGFGGCKDLWTAAQALEQGGMEGVLYADIADPRGLGLLTFSDDEDHFVSKVRPFLNREPFAALEFKPEYSMLGRTYAIGYEPNLEDWLLNKPRRTALNRDWPWAVWYPLRRKGEFSRLSPEEQKGILREHGAIGHAFGDADYAHDIRLACHGLDKSDNDFVIGLVGKRLHPLSALVETMRRTVQTSQYIQAMGPFFIGKALWQSAYRG